MRDLARDGRGGLPLALRLLVIRPPDDGFSPETERNRSTYCLELISHVPLRPRTRNRFFFFFYLAARYSFAVIFMSAKEGDE